MTTLATLLWFRNVRSGWGQTNTDQLFSLGDFRGRSGDTANFSVWELALFVMIGCLGGLVGAIFNAANEHLTIWRKKNVNHSPIRRVS